MMRGEYAGEVDPETFRRVVVVAVERIIEANPGRRVAVVCHGGVINAWASHGARDPRRDVLRADLHERLPLRLLEPRPPTMVSLNETGTSSPSGWRRPDPGHAWRAPLLRSTHQVPAPARSTCPPSAGQRGDDLVARRWIGVCAPLLLTHTTAPPGASTRSTSAGNRKALTSTTASARPAATGSRAGVGQDPVRRPGRAPSQHLGRDLESQDVPVALGQQARVGADPAAHLEGEAPAGDVPTLERVRHHRVALGRRAGVPLRRQAVEVGRDLPPGALVPGRLDEPRPPAGS
jgi:hypothetical protein